MAAIRKPAVALGPGKVTVAVTINGRALQAQFEPCTTLLDAMREFWGLTGAKRVCDRGTCGACTVLLNGERVYACSILAIDVGTGTVTTIESLPDSDPVKQAFVAHDAMQCGFCTPGFVMSCKGFLAENSKPTGDDLLRGVSGNVCRCGSYAGILAALNQLADAAPAPSAKRRARSAAPRSKTVKAAGVKRRPTKTSGSKGH